MSSRPRILVVDDEQNIRRSLDLILRGEGFEVREAATGEDALRLAEDEAMAAVFLDLNLPGIDGIEVLRRLKSERPELAVIMISGHGTIERAVEATRLGAFDFVEKPFARERVVVLARNATEAARLRSENERLRAADEPRLLGASPVLRELEETIARVAPTEARVLILGESGTGKELVAQAIHRRSGRANGPFVRVNCAAIPEELIEAELFGAVKGAYTGAQADRPGRFAAADGGTLLLDEVGDMSLRAQVKVLRVLQESQFEPVGSTRTQSVDARVLAATHQDLPRLVAEGRFREDLLFRLNVIPLRVAPLRERPGDVRVLTEAFVQEYARHHGLPPSPVETAALKLLEAYAWPGNVRELRNVVERLVVLGAGRPIAAGDVPEEIRGEVRAPANVAGENPYASLPLRDAKQALEKDLIEAALRKHGGNVTQAAKELGLERTHLHKRIKALHVRIGE